MPTDVQYTPAELSTRLGVSKSTLLRWERDDDIPPPERDRSTQRNARVYSREQIHAFVEKQTQQLRRQLASVNELGEKQKGRAGEARAQSNLQALMETHSLSKLLEGNILGLQELMAYDDLAPATIVSLIQIALEQCSPTDALFADILEVALEKSRNASASQSK
jgi:DNA-binding transcriptional MerR regulator